MTTSSDVVELSDERIDDVDTVVAAVVVNDDDDAAVDERIVMMGISDADFGADVAKGANDAIGGAAVATEGVVGASVATGVGAGVAKTFVPSNGKTV
jgi:hypothetical protein